MLTEIRIHKGNNVDDNDCESRLDVKMKIESRELQISDYSSQYAANTTLPIQIKKEASSPKSCAEKQELSVLRYKCEEEEVGDDYSSEYATNTTYWIKMEEAATRTKLKMGKPLNVNLQTKYEYEEEIVSSDSGTSTRKFYIFEDKICRFCHVKFRYAIHYQKHFKEHHPEAKSYACPSCPFTIRRRQKFMHHLKSEHPDLILPARKSESNRFYKCELCPTEHRGIRKFENHAISHHKGMKIIKCPLCNTLFSRFGSLARHKMVKHGMLDAEFLCKFCGNVFQRSDDLENHVGKCKDRQTKKKTGTHQFNIRRFEKEETLKTCYECGDKFANVRLLKSHLKCVHPESKRSYVCKVCHHSFTKLYSLEKHTDKFHPDEGIPIKISRKGQKFECQYCREEFQGLGLYEAHGISAHGEDQKSFRCAECGEGFNRKHILKRHVIGVHKVPTIPCNTCKKLFPTLGRKNVHEKYCGKNHCDICNKEICSQSSLKGHVIRLHGKSSIPCQHCYKYFATPSDVKKHEKKCRKRLAGEMPTFFCNICRRTLHGSAAWHDLKHEDYDYCRFCHQRFHRVRNPDGILNHMAKRHPDQFYNNVCTVMLGTDQSLNEKDMKREES